MGGAYSRPPSRLAAPPREDAEREDYVEFVDVVVPSREASADSH